MVYQERLIDLFSVSDEYYLAHCISADFEMGKGIATEFNKRFNMKRKLQSKYPDYYFEWVTRNHQFNCILEDKVFNLITKERYFHKPEYFRLSGSLSIMQAIAQLNNITKIAMPTIGCGLDGLKWNKVSKIIKNIFKDTDIEILICIK